MGKVEQRFIKKLRSRGNKAYRFPVSVTFLIFVGLMVILEVM